MLEDGLFLEIPSRQAQARGFDFNAGCALPGFSHSLSSLSFVSSPVFIVPIPILTNRLGGRLFYPFVLLSSFLSLVLAPLIRSFLKQQYFRLINLPKSTIETAQGLKSFSLSILQF